MVIEVLQKENERQRRMGIKQGVKQGIKQGTLNIAQKMLQLGMKVEDIQKVTGLTKEEIKKL